MCHYCGCREIPLIKRFIAEHERVTDAAGDALRALERGEAGRARELVDAMTAELAALDLTDPADVQTLTEAVQELHHHIAKEEDGLFPASLTALSGEEWNAAMTAWRKAHP